MGEGDLWITVLLKEKGLLRFSARGAAGGKVRFGGGTEPFVWGVFHYYQGRSGGLHLESVDVADDMLPLRKRPEALFMAVRWSKWLTRHVPPGIPADDLLAALYWNMRLLGDKALPAEVAEWRLLSRWLKGQGLAPDLTRCGLCGQTLGELAWTSEGLVCERCSPEAHSERPVFAARQLEFLDSVARMKTSDLEGLEEKERLWQHKNLFKLGSRCLEGFLLEI